MFVSGCVCVSCVFDVCVRCWLRCKLFRLRLRLWLRNERCVLCRVVVVWMSWFVIGVVLVVLICCVGEVSCRFIGMCFWSGWSVMNMF